MAEDDLLSTPQAAARLAMTPRHVRLIAARDGIGRKVGRDYAFAAADLPRLLAGVRARPGGRGRPVGWRKAGGE